MSRDLYQTRRKALFEQLPEGCIVILADYQQKIRSKNIKYHFRQDNDFLYLTGFDGAIIDFNADEAYDIAELETVLLSQLTTQRHIFIGDELGRFSSRVIGWMNHQRNTTSFDTIKHHLSLTPLAKVLHPLRVIKSADEIAKTKAAVKASTDGHRAVMQACKPGVNGSLCIGYHS
ncbi:Xaa-pro aminopeptidase (fragment) [Shewanella benthica]|uniref:Xaa-Pro aminopeptidase n=1 Tax=Shewanella benthica TaxID=43661 RepID=A0A330M1W1_9GAMM